MLWLQMNQKRIKHLINRRQYVLTWFWIDLKFVLSYFHSQNLIGVKEKELLRTLFDVVHFCHGFFSVIWKLCYYVVFVQLILDYLIKVEILVDLFTLTKVFDQSSFYDERITLNDMQWSHLFMTIFVLHGVLINRITQLLLLL